MKKALLLSMAAVLALSAGAQWRTQYVQPTSVDLSMADNSMADAPEAYEAAPGTPGVISPVKAPVAAPVANYYRPAGAFFGAFSGYQDTVTYSTFYSPYIVAWPYREGKYINATVNPEETTYDWFYQVYSGSAGHAWYQDTNTDLVVEFPNANDTVPTLTATNALGQSSFKFQGAKVTSSEIDTWFTSQVLARVDYQHAYSNTSDRILWETPKYWAANTDRYATKLAGGYYITGAKDADGGTTGKWLGRNWSGVDKVGTAFEAPEHPYVLRQVGVRYQNLKGVDGFDGEFDFKVEVYRISHMIPYDDLETESPELLELLGEGRIVISAEEANMRSSKNGIMAFTLTTTDDDGVEMEVQPEIDFPILVLFSGYNVEGMHSDFTLLRSSDVYNDGHGDVAYLAQMNDQGEYDICCIHNFFTSKPMYNFSVYIETERPWLVFNWNAEDGVFKFPVEGGSYSKVFNSKTYDYIQFYSYRSVDEWDWALADGGDIPEWLTLTLSDEMNSGEFANLVDVKATAAALPEDVPYREAKVRFHFNGAYCDYLFTQGEKVDPQPGNPLDVDGNGTVDITDMNIIIDVILGQVENPKADVNNNGIVDINDMNLVINYVLGVE